MVERIIWFQAEWLLACFLIYIMSWPLAMLGWYLAGFEITALATVVCVTKNFLLVGTKMSRFHGNA